MDKSMNHAMPRARQEELLVHELADEVLVYDLKRHKAHSLNKTAALVWQRCDGQSSVTEITRLLEQELATSVDEDVVRLALDQLERARLLGERPSQATGGVRVSRRQLMRRMGLAAAVSLPLVVSILAPTAQAAVSCTVNGQTCQGNGNCCSGNCVGNVCVA
ncbi:MAG: PqqD family protein [Acidobacteriota bacterium]